MVGVNQLSQRLTRVTFGGPELGGLAIPEPAASVRLLIPSSPGGRLVMPEWNGNEFLLPDGTRPTIRTFTPSLVGPDDLELDLDIVLHGAGAVARWAAAAQRGSEAAVSGPGRGYTFDPAASAYLILGDETAIPAIGQLLGAAPDGAQIEAHIEIPHPEAALGLAAHGGGTVHWHESDPDSAPGSKLLDVLEAANLAEGTRIWAAGEAAGMQRIRRHLFETRSIPRSEATVRGYWKVARGDPA